MKKQAIVVSVLALALLLALPPALPARADLTPGHVDTGFAPGLGADNEVLVLAIQADGKVLIGGNFTTVNTLARNRIARLDADGAVDTSFVPSTGVDGRVRAVAVQTDGKVLIGGSFTTVNGVTRNRIARLNANGSLDTTFDPGTGADGAVRSLLVRDDGRILIGGEFTTVDGETCNRVARLHADGTVDTLFDPGTGASGVVYALAEQPDGKVLVGGGFSTFDGVARNRIARLNADGSLDTSFDPGSGADNWVDAVVLQSDGKVLVGGLFSTFDGVARSRIARLDSDGSLDTSFDPGTGANAVVNDLALQPDGRVLIGGAFSTVDGVARNRIARLETDGSVDVSFDPGTGADSSLWALALQFDGKVLAGGEFTTVDGVSRNRVARLNVDGSLDVGFDPGTGASSQVQAVVLQPDGRVLIGGYFTTVDGVARNRIARLRANGSLDTSFDPGTGADNPVRSVALQPDGKVLIGGLFTSINGVGRNRIARLNADGSLDAGFNPGTGADGTVVSVAVQSGKAVIGGSFTTVDGTARNGIARLNKTGSLDTSFDPGSGANDSVLAVAIQDDGKVLIGGDFTTVNGVARNHIARLDVDGSLDTSFDPGGGPNLLVRTVVVQANGQVLIGGSFTSVDGVSRNRIALLDDDGSLETRFDPGTGASDWVQAVAVQSDRKILIGGAFTTVNGTACNHIARLNQNGSVDTGFVTSAGADDNVYAIAVQPDGKVLIGGDFNKRVARLNGATPPAITSDAPPSPATVGVAYTHSFRASGYPVAPRFYVTDGDLPPGLALDAASGELSGTPTTAGNYGFVVSACNYAAPCDSQQVYLVVKGEFYSFLPLMRR
jgi:uncharacterized delta-60 repeat protein